MYILVYKHFSNDHFKNIYVDGSSVLIVCECACSEVDGKHSVKTIEITHGDKILVSLIGPSNSTSIHQRITG